MKYIIDPRVKSSIQNELITAQVALSEGNDGKARVAARRVVVAVMQEVFGANLGVEFTSSAALEYLAKTMDFPETVRSAATRLQGGLRAKIEGNVYSENPIDDAEIIIRYFS
ncbi:MAG: hypothetical protein U0264_00280 [Candidatus Kapaibacterium sp.]